MEVFGHGSMIVVDRGHIDEFLSVPEEQISFQAGFDSFSLYLMFVGDVRNSYHNSIIRKMAQNLATSEIVEELTAAFADELEPQVGKGNTKLYAANIDYKRIEVFKTLLPIMARVVHRQFVGLPVCTFPTQRNSLYLGRNKEYLEAISQHSISVGLASVVLRYVPHILKKFDILWLLFT